MAVDASLVVQEDASVFDFVFGDAYEERSFSQDNPLNRSQCHKAIELLNNQVRVDSIREHPQQTISYDNHDILNSMYLLDQHRKLEISYKTKALSQTVVGQLCHKGATLMGEQNQQSLLLSVSADLDIDMPDQLVVGGLDEFVVKGDGLQVDLIVFLEYLVLLGVLQIAHWVECVDIDHLLLVQDKQQLGVFVQFHVDWLVSVDCYIYLLDQFEFHAGFLYLVDKDA